MNRFRYADNFCNYYQFGISNANLILIDLNHFATGFPLKNIGVQAEFFSTKNIDHFWRLTETIRVIY